MGTSMTLRLQGRGLAVPGNLLVTTLVAVDGKAPWCLQPVSWAHSSVGDSAPAAPSGVRASAVEGLWEPALHSAPSALVDPGGPWRLTGGDDFALLFTERSGNASSELCMLFSNAVPQRQDGRFRRARASSL